MIRTFRKKPVEVQAIQWNDTVTALEALQSIGAPIAVATDGTRGLIVGTLEDGPNGQVQHYANVGDFIIRGVKGEFYPCKADIMAVTYDEVIDF